MKKFISLLLSSTMLMSTVPMARAENLGTINAVEADPEAIYVYSSVSNLSADLLKEASVLKQDGVDITADCTFTAVKDNVTGGGSPEAQQYRYCTKITPPTGAEFEVNKEITFEVTDSTEIENYSTKFTIYELLNDDFENGLNWKATSGTAPTIDTESNGNKRLSLSRGNVVINKDYANQTVWKDYTISFDMIGGDAAYTEGEVVKFIWNTAANPTTTAGASLKNYYNIQTGTVRTYNDGLSWYHGNGNGKVEAVMKNGSNHRYKFNVQDGYSSARVNGVKFMELALPEANNTRTGAPSFAFVNSKGSLYVDNLRVTKTVKSDDISDLTFKDKISVDTDGIMLYPSAGVNLSMMAQMTTLVDGDGVNIPVAVEKVIDSENYHNTFVQDAPYIIKRADGQELETDKSYTLTIKPGVISSDFTSVSSASFVKTFELVNVFSDDFSGDLKWEWVHTNPDMGRWSNNTMEIAGGKLEVTLGDKNNSDEVRLVPKDYKNMLDLENCTVKFDFNSVDSTYSGNWTRFGFTSKEDLSDSKDSHGEFHLQNGVLRVYVNAESFDWTNDVVYDKDTFVSCKEVTCKYVGDGLEYSFYNDKGIRLAKKAETNEKYKAKGAFSILFYGNTGGKYTLDNVKITRMIEYVDVVPEVSENCDIDMDSMLLIVDKPFDVDTVSKDAVSITEGDKPYTDFTVEAVDEQTIKVNFGKELQYKTEYSIQLADTIVLNDVASYRFNAAKFKTIVPPFDLDSFVLDGNEVKATLKNNRSDSPVSCVTTVACYDENNMILGVVNGGKYELYKKDTKYVKMTVPTGTKKAVCYVWDNFTSMGTMFEETITID